MENRIVPLRNRMIRALPESMTPLERDCVIAAIQGDVTPLMFATAGDDLAIATAAITIRIREERACVVLTDAREEREGVRASFDDVLPALVNVVRDRFVPSIDRDRISWFAHVPAGRMLTEVRVEHLILRVAGDRCVGVATEAVAA